jgi:hydroxymethylbilane synthase
VEAERAFLAELGSGCSLPVGVHAVDGRLTGFLADPAAGRTVRRSVGLTPGDLAVARRLAAELAAEVARPGPHTSAG